jgi:hypothetical protein
MSERIGMPRFPGSGTSSKYTTDPTGSRVRKPDTYHVGPNVNLPIPHTYNIPGIPGSFPKGGKKRGPKW